MEYREFGTTGLKVSRLGLGLAEISRREQHREVEDADKVLSTALDNGINFLDTAECYGRTEELIGQTVAHRRDEYVLATKAGHIAGDATGDPWTAETISHSIDRSLTRLKTDAVDLVQLHSPTLDALQQGEIVEALVRARDAGKTRFIGCSGDNEVAHYAVESGQFASLQTSFNLVDQHARDGLLRKARSAGMGVIIKRPVANGVWGKGASPYEYADRYFERWQAMHAMGPLPDTPDDPMLLAMGFVAAQPEVDTIIAGTHNPAHVLSNIDMIERQLLISSEVISELQRRFKQLGADWEQLG